MRLRVFTAVGHKFGGGSACCVTEWVHLYVILLLLLRQASMQVGGCAGGYLGSVACVAVTDGVSARDVPVVVTAG